MILFLQSYEKELKHGCYIHFRAAIICSFADISVPLQPRVGPIVQWIERRFPKPLIWVRFPVRVQSLSYKEVIGSYKEVNSLRERS